MLRQFRFSLTQGSHRHQCRGRGIDAFLFGAFQRLLGYGIELFPCIHLNHLLLLAEGSPFGVK